MSMTLSTAVGKRDDSHLEDGHQEGPDWEESARAPARQVDLLGTSVSLIVIGGEAEVRCGRREDNSMFHDVRYTSSGLGTRQARCWVYRLVSNVSSPLRAKERRS